MPSITGFTSTRSQEIEDSVIESAAIVANHLILTKHDGSTMDAGDINGGQQIPHSAVTQVTTSGGVVPTTLSTFNNLHTPLSVSGFQKYRADTKLIFEYEGSIYNNDPAGQYEVAAAVSGVNRVVANGYSTWGANGGMVQATGIAAGTYTITILYRRVNGVGSVYDGYPGGRNCLKVTESF